MKGNGTFIKRSQWAAARRAPAAVYAALLLLALLALLGRGPSAPVMPQAPSGTPLPEDPSLCDRSLTIFKQMPLALELPVSRDYEQEASPALSKVVLRRNLKLAAGGETRSFNLYVYEGGDIVSQHVSQKGAWESTLVKQVLTQLKGFAKAKGLQPEEVYFIDVGGNLGTFTIPVAAHGFRVLTFEAMYSNAMAIRMSICANPGLAERVTLINKGLGNATASCHIVSPTINVGNGMLRCGARAKETASSGTPKRAALEIERLDDVLRDASLLAQLSGRVGAIKLDVEGYEPLALEGGTAFLKAARPPYIVAECDGGAIQSQAGYPAGRFLDHMAGLGYSVFDGWREVPRGSVLEHKCGSWDTTGSSTIYFKLKD